MRQASRVNQGVDSGVSDPETVAFTCAGTAERSADITHEGKVWPVLAVLLHSFCDLHRKRVSTGDMSV